MCSVEGGHTGSSKKRLSQAHTGSSTEGVGKLLPGGQTWPNTCFLKVLLERLGPLVHLSTMAARALQR